ncbi:A24 family peptidase [Kitasatospora sp. NPDC048540]|uniref:prepilin peptidase n=1 Tax=unclassified Kitasatospora TaxID=2633591 RepID=UPI00053BAFEF|nr:A24 family peptidase [Kitasatospora sp. MBT63]
MIAVVSGAAAGLLAAPVLRAAAARYAVADGEPWRECCPLGRRLHRPDGRCPRCGAGGGPGAWRIETAAAAVGAVLGAAASWPVVLPLAWAALFGVVLAFVDARVSRLPDVLTLPLAAGTAVLLVLTAPDGAVLLRCLFAALVLGGGYLLLALVAPVGLGDVKLAPTLGALLGWYGWSAVAGGFVLTFLAAAVWAVALLVSGRAGRGDDLPLGPWMLLGTLLAVLAAS